MNTTLPRTPCKGCGKPIVFGKTEDGKIIPLDLSPPIYRVFTAADGVVRCLRLEDGPNWQPAVTHFATCAKANQFSKKGKGS